MNAPIKLQKTGTDLFRQPVFVERRDFEYYLANLQEWKQA